MTIESIQAEVAVEAKRIRCETKRCAAQFVGLGVDAMLHANHCCMPTSRNTQRAELVKAAAYALLALEAMDESEPR